MSESSWVKSKLLRFFVIYVAVIIALTYLVEWTDRHGAALHLVLVGLVVGLIGYLLLRLIVWWRASRLW